ncbi:Zn-ribbon domain-containing OB-fold protein [Conexibacter sp. SYSU D00693]|uniref:Zn-ribbon domain-containing OB-fold protein n=1 Tax=Conexibacter sp. SYSU D00693 TaxID=2812560 RepID=UPI00196A6C8F|nr:OB-fold domain-containing protein [Conexibacter sp. SYSU D00693]
MSAVAVAHGTWVRCQSCGAGFYPGQRRCTACGSWDALREEPLPATGTLFTFTVIHVATATPPLPVPYALGYVDLDDGPRVLAPIATAADPETTLAAGTRLALVVHPAGDPVPFHMEVLA